MIRLRRSPYLSSIVMLCVALSFVLANQSYILLIDRVQHALHHEHAPNPLAGPVVHCEHAHGDHNIHHHCGAEDHGIDSAVTHQHLDSSIVYIVTPAPLLAQERQSSFVHVAVPEGLDRIYPYRLDRPPKA